MKKILLTAGICMMGLFAVQAQQTAGQTGPTTEQRVEKMMNGITGACKLTPEQVTKVKPIITEAVNERTANKTKYGSDKDKLEAANKETVKEANAKMSAILTPEQQSQLIAYEQEQKAAMQEKASATGGDKK